MIEPPKIIETSAQTIAVIPVTVARDKIQIVMGPGIQELVAALKTQGVPPTGPWFTHHLRRPSDTFDFEIAVPVASAVAASGRMKQSQMPAMTAAHTMYSGPYEGLAGAWGEFLNWVRTNGHTSAPDLYERYITGPESSPDPATWRTELIQPLETS